jgi:hypothetical protein
VPGALAPTKGWEMAFQAFAAKKTKRPIRHTDFRPAC